MTTEETEEVNLLQVWLKKDPARWIAGILGGLLSGLVMLAFSMIAWSLMGEAAWIPLTIPALPFLGAKATSFEMTGTAIPVGVVAHELLCAFLGFVYAHFTGTNSLSALLGVGITWGIFAWIFLNNLFLPSFRQVHVFEIPGGTAFFAWLVFGISLTSVAFFDRVLRKNASD